VNRRNVAEALVRYGPVAMTDGIVGANERKYAKALRTAPRRHSWSDRSREDPTPAAVGFSDHGRRCDD